MTDDELALQSFLADVMHPNVEDAKSNPNDHRSVFNACASIEAAASGLYWILVGKGLLSNSITDAAYKSRLAYANEHFHIVHDAAEAQKHGRLTRPTKPPRVISSANDLKSAQHGWGHSRADEMIWGADDAISVTVDGVARAVASNAVYAANFLEGEVYLADSGMSVVLPWTK